MGFVHSSPPPYAATSFKAIGWEHSRTGLSYFIVSQEMLMEFNLKADKKDTNIDHITFCHVSSKPQGDDTEVSPLQMKSEVSCLPKSVSPKP